MSTTTYNYDLNGNVTQKAQPNGTVETRVYDARNRVSSITNTIGVVTLSRYEYGYDGVGNVTEVAESYVTGGLTGRTIVNTYDQANRLTNEEITSGGTVVTTDYTYDNGHNRTAKSVTGGAHPGTTTYEIGTGSNGAGANQIKSVTLPDSTVVGFSYDANGNRVGKTIGGDTDIYSYDNENRLVSLSQEIGGTALYTYAYDYRTRRVTRDEPAGTTQVAFSGGTSIIESGASSAEFVRGPGQGGGVGGLGYSDQGGAVRFNQYNSRGDVVGQTDSSGTLTYQAAYEAFGQHPVETGSNDNPQQANTKEEDPTGLLNEGFRYRDLETGTFITRDPIGLAGGPNDYIYCRQNPWTYFDPQGLAPNEWDIKIPTAIVVDDSKLVNASAHTEVDLKVEAIAKKTADGLVFDHYKIAFVITTYVMSKKEWVKSGHSPLTYNHFLDIAPQGENQHVADMVKWANTIGKQIADGYQVPPEFMRGWSSEQMFKNIFDHDAFTNKLEDSMEEALQKTTDYYDKGSNPDHRFYHMPDNEGNLPYEPPGVIKGNKTAPWITPTPKPTSSPS